MESLYVNSILLALTNLQKLFVRRNSLCIRKKTSAPAWIQSQTPHTVALSPYSLSYSDICWPEKSSSNSQYLKVNG